MIERLKKLYGPRARRLLSGLGALCLFVLLGVIFSPGLTRRQPAPPESSFERAPEREATEQLAAASADPDASRVNAAAAIETQTEVTDTFDCMIRPSEVVEVGSAITGRIEAIAFERSDYVKKGDTVVQLESTVEAAAVRVARASAERLGEIESSQASLELGLKKRDRGVELHESNSLSLDLRETLETEATLAAARLKQAEENQRLAFLQLEQAEASLERRTIKSPIAGYVVDRLMAPGEVVEDETILRIAQVDPLRVEAILPAELFGQVRAGDLAEIVPEAPLDEPRRAAVAIVDPVIDGASATFGATLHLENADRGIPAGLRCRVHFLGRAAEAPAAEAAVASAEGADGNG